MIIKRALRFFKKEGACAVSASVLGLACTAEITAGGASLLKRALTERTKIPLENPKNILSTIPRINRERYGLR